VQNEDDWVRLDDFTLSGDQDNTHGTEAIESISFEVSELNDLGLVLKVDGEIVDLSSDTGTLTYDYATSTIEVMTDPDGVRANSDNVYGIPFSYTLTDTVDDYSVSGESKTGTYYVNVNPVTDDPTFVDTGSDDWKNYDTSVLTDVTLDSSTENADLSFTKTLDLTSIDLDGSEQITRVEVELPNGVSLDNATAISVGDETTTWSYSLDSMTAGSDINTDGIFDITVNATSEITLTMTADGAYNLGTTTNTITVYTLDNGVDDGYISDESAEENSISATFDLTITDNGTGGTTGDGTDPIEATLTESAVFGDITQVVEGSTIAVSDLISATLTDNATADTLFSISLTLAADTEVTTTDVFTASGGTITQVGDTIMISGTGDNTTLQSLLDEVSVKFDEDFSTNDNMVTSADSNEVGYVEASVTLSAYDAITQDSTVTDTSSITVMPVTDSLDNDGVVQLVTTSEDVAVDVPISLANSSDNQNGTYTDIVATADIDNDGTDDKGIYLSLDESAYTNNDDTDAESTGSLVIKNDDGTTTDLEVITFTDDNAPEGMSAGTYYFVPSSDGQTLPNIEYVPAANNYTDGGDVSVTSYIYTTEDNNYGVDAGTVLSTQTFNIDVTSTPDPINIEVDNVVGTEDIFAELDYTEIQIDPDSQLATINFDEVPEGWVIAYNTDGTTPYYDESGNLVGGTLASSAGSSSDGTESWYIPVDDDSDSPNIYILASAQESVDIATIEIYGVTTDGLKSDEVSTPDISIVPDADEITLDPTQTFAEQADWTDLNLNSKVYDDDGSEVVSLTIASTGSTSLLDTAGDLGLSFRYLDSSTGEYIEIEATSTGGVYDVSGIPAQYLDSLQIRYIGEALEDGTASGFEGEISITPSVTDTFGDVSDTWSGSSSTMTLTIANSSLLTADADILDLSSSTSDYGYILDALDGNDVITGGAKADTISGGAGDDTISGENARDIIYGGAGNDTLDGGSAQDKIYGGADDDTIHGDGGKDTLYGDAGNDTIYGGVDDDSIKGGEGDDKLYGQSGADTISGDDGDDTLYGGKGDDILVDKSVVAKERIP